MQPAFDFESTTVLHKGHRRYQEDAIISDFARGTDMGLVVLSDGMGGHSAGDVASKIVVTEVFSELLFRRTQATENAFQVPGFLADAAYGANTCLQKHTLSNPETRGMGATLVAAVVLERRLFWISIGDSPLYLFRRGELIQLNEDHSMAPQIDFMVKSGFMTSEVGANRPDRNTLTSVLYGAEIPKIDCPSEPLILQHGDIVLVASDGVQCLSDVEIRSLLLRCWQKSSMEIGDSLIERVFEADNPELDNVSFAVIKVSAGVPQDQACCDSVQPILGAQCAG